MSPAVTPARLATELPTLPVQPAILDSPSTQAWVPATARTDSSLQQMELVLLVTTLAQLVTLQILAHLAEQTLSLVPTTDVFATMATTWIPTESANSAATTALLAVEQTTTIVCLASPMQPSIQVLAPAHVTLEQTLMETETVLDQTATTPALLAQVLPTTNVHLANRPPL